MQLSFNPPALIFTVRSLPKNFAGMANGPIIRIDSRYVNDIGLLAHEKTHVLQFWVVSFLSALFILGLSVLYPLFLCCLPIVFGVHGLLYLTLSPYRLWAELTAYRKQLSYSKNPDVSAELFGKFIASKYRLKISAESATYLLKEQS